jgi:hypothetical protein
MSMQVSGMLMLGEAQATMRAVGARQRGSSLWYWGTMLALGLGGALLGIVLLPRYFPIEPAAAGGLGWIVGAVAYIVLSPHLTVLLFRRRLSGRGIRRELPFSIAVTPDALVYEVGDVRQIAQWRAVTELFRSKGYWIFLV